MAGYLIHLAVARLAADQLFPNDSDSKNHFLCGALFPDAFDKKQKDMAHYYLFPDADQVFRTCDLNAFRIRIPEYRNNPFLFGYYAHLFTDQLFYHGFLSKWIEVLYSKRCPYLPVEIFLKKQQKVIEKQLFFSESYLKGDYSKMNADIIKHFRIEQPSANDIVISRCFIGCPSEPDCVSKLNDLLKSVKDLIDKSTECKGDSSVFDKYDLFDWIRSTANFIVHSSLLKLSQSETLTMTDYGCLWTLFPKKLCPSGLSYRIDSYTSTDITQGNDKAGWVLPDILTRWEQNWDRTNEKNDFFFQWFVSTYNNVSHRAVRNMKLNFAAKRMFLWLVSALGGLNAVAVAFYLLICSLSSQFHLDAAFLLAIEGAVVLFSLLIALPVAKWIDVNKYQETWARHRTQLENMEIEMLKYICCIKPYNKQNSCENSNLFIHKILATEKNTARTFLALMTEQEKGLLDELIQLK